MRGDLDIFRKEFNMEETMAFLKSFHFTNAVWVLLIPVSLMGLDVITGYLKACIKHEVRSSRMREGLAKKFGEITILIIGKLFEYGLGIPTYIMNIISLYIIIMELVSIAENLDKMGVPIPKFVKKRLGDVEEKMLNDAPNSKDDGKEV